jgi:GH15 family glucan-1,4-alpha-glucosidase
MARPVVLGNGSMFVGLNEQGLVHDFYYPYVGMENLSNARISPHKIGIFVDGAISWVDDDSWQRTIDFRDTALVSKLSMQNDVIGVRLEFEDFADVQYNAFIRSITVHNLSDQEREIRVFMHQAFQISRGGRADTALFEPEDHYILDYKGYCCVLTYGQFEDGVPFDQYAVGNFGIEGKEGSFRDADDGILSGNAIEHGGVDSVIGFTRHIDAGASQEIDYWLVAADSQHTAETIHKAILSDSPAVRLKMAEDFWGNWLRIADSRISSFAENDQVMIRKSLLIAKAHTDRRGGVIASGDSSIYNYGRDYYSYVWPRDGAYVFWPLVRLGYTDEAKRFFEFCRDILNRDGYLMHKYQPDRAIGSSWHPLVHGNHAELAIQEDETAIVMVLLHEFLKKNPGQEDFVRNLYGTFIDPAASFMESFFDASTQLPHATYDLWEEKFLTSSYTVAVTYRALLSASDIATQLGHADDALRWQLAAETIAEHISLLYDNDTKILHKGMLLTQQETIETDAVLDISSMYGFDFFNMPAEDVTEATLAAVEERLLNSAPIGGVPRYEGDNYFRSEPPYQGNPWFVGTLWLAQSYIKRGRKDEARKLIDWTMQQTLPSGVLAEQINPTTGEPVGVAPLVWSHAELIRTLLDYYEQ